MWSGMVPDETLDEAGMCEDCGALTYSTTGFCQECLDKMIAEDQAERDSEIARGK